MTRFHGRTLGKELIAEGLVPPHCFNVELHVPTDGAVVLHYEVYVTDDDLAKVRRAFGRMLTPPAVSDTE